jgi:hypothetical protein
MALAMNQLDKEVVQEIEMDIDSCPVCGDTGKVANFDGECIEYEHCPNPECIPVSVLELLQDLGHDPVDLSDLPF